MDEQKELDTNSAAPESTTEPLPDIEIPTLRTYKGDIGRTVNREKITTAKILVAEQKKRESSNEKVLETSIKRPTNILVLLLAIIMIVGGVGVVGYFGYEKVVKKTFAPITVQDSFLFVFDNEKFIDGTNDKFEVYANVEKNIQDISKLKNGTYTDLVFYKTDSNTEEKKRITSAEFFNLYDISLPTNIARSISQDFVYGIYKTDERIEPFVVVGLVDYENAFSAMFIWESTLAFDIKNLFPVLKNLFTIKERVSLNLNQEYATSTEMNAATSTATSTISESNSASSTQVSTSSVVQLTPKQQFEIEKANQEVINRSIRFIDIIFSNKDTRAVRDPNGNPFFYYAFIDREKLLFAQDPKIIGEISRKIKQKSLVR